MFFILSMSQISCLVSSINPFSCVLRFCMLCKMKQWRNISNTFLIKHILLSIKNEPKSNLFVSKLGLFPFINRNTGLPS